MTLDEIDSLVERHYRADGEIPFSILDLLKKLTAVARAAKDAAERLDSSDNGWVLDDVREALAALESKT